MADFATSAIHNVGNTGLFNTAMNRNIFTPQAINAYRTAMSSPLGVGARTIFGIPAAVASTPFLAASGIDALTKRDPNATQSSLFGIDLTKNANEGAALPGSTLNDWGSPMGDVPDGGVVPPTKKINTPLNTLDSNWQHQLRMQDIDRGNIDNRGFSFNPLNWGIAGMMKRMVEPNTPEENFGLKYFGDRNTLSPSGRTYGNQAYDVFAGKNVASAFGQGMGGAAQKRIDTINKTLSDWEAKAAEGDEAAIQRLKNTTLIRRRDEFRKQLDAYNKDLAAGTGGADTTGGAFITKKTTPDGGGYTGPRTYDFDRAAFQRSGGQRASRDGFTDPGRGSYGPHMAQGGRIGYRNGEFVDEDINIEGPGYDFNENIEMTSGEGEGDILEQLVAKYIEAGFPPDQAEEMAMQELQQIVAQSGQGEGIASLV